MVAAGVAVTLAAWATRGTSATWRVAPDGSQPFSELQTALDFTAPGDTVLLYPGRYDVGRWTAGPSGSSWQLGAIEHDRIVVRGTDRAQVVLGPAALPAQGAIGVGLGMAAGTRNHRVEHLTIENMGIAVQATGNIAVRDVSVRFCGTGCEVRAATDVVVEDCAFHAVRSSILVDDSENLWIRDCSLTGATSAVQVHGVTGVARIERCSMLDIDGGILVQDVPNMEIFDTELRAAVTGVWVTGRGTRLRLSGTRLSGAETTLWVTDRAQVSGTQNVFYPGTHAIFEFRDGATAQLAANHIVLGSPPGIHTAYYSTAEPTVHLDLAHNYWGTTSADMVAAYIIDGHVNPSIGAIVDFQPMADGPVPSKSVSFGELKAGFGAN